MNILINNLTNAGKLLLSIVICQAAGIIGTVFTRSSVATWYTTLQKPVFNPPNWVFGPVWTTLYTLMGISLYLVWQKKQASTNFKLAIVIFGVQLVLNALWSIIFFGSQSIIGGLATIIALWVAILLTIIKFYPISHLASYLLVPYFLWVSYAGILNYNLWILNK